MTKKAFNVVQWVSIFVGITGMSLDKLIAVSPTLSYVLIGISAAAFIILVIVQLNYRDPNQFEGKQQVNLAWRTLLTRAESSVDVFAGDVSWAQGSKKILARRTGAGIVMRVLCRWPSTPALLLQVRALFEAGVQVKYYDGELVQVRGLVIDAQSVAGGGTALTVVKSPKHQIDLAKGNSGSDSLFEYRARRFLPPVDIGHVAMLHQLFQSIWAGLPQGLILSAHMLGEVDIRKILSNVPHYTRLRPGDISIENISCEDLYSCCRTVKSAKLQNAAYLIEGYRRFGLDLFEPCKIEQGGVRRLLLPPIVERQADGRMVVVDGMHRIYQLTTRTDIQQVVCVVLTGLGALPSNPIPFGEVRVSPTKKPRAENFPSYQHQNFRDVKAVDRHLATLLT